MASEAGLLLGAYVAGMMTTLLLVWWEQRVLGERVGNVAGWAVLAILGYLWVRYVLVGPP